MKGIDNKRILLLFGICDIITFLNVANLLWHYLTNMLSGFWLMSILTSSIILSLVATAYFNFTNPKLGIKIYYFQFPLRLAFVILTFGFLTYLNRITTNDISQQIIFVAMALELFRLVVSILTHRQLNREIVGG
ncbi:hypothetical protein C7460_1442 [Marinoscillum furvescens DSM 4134]|uniref:Uncharacterized protein n=1 Tax=Marinoscillum furvescens DSM 4134 TaxID=1122208 RepID=A0A3D9KWH5_MARFU|nr:hypothetical protein C7460_1442 [Marinoscillum furvescens DSM 4134]